MKNKMLTILCIVLALALLGVGIFFVLPQISDRNSSQEDTAQEDSSAKLEVDPNVGAKTTPTPQPKEPGIAIPGWESITLPAGTTEAEVALENPEANKDYYYLTFELCLKDTNEVIFTTGLVPPGQSCNQVTLTRELEAGEYEAVIHVQPYKMDENQTPTNNADMESMLVVK